MTVSIDRRVAEDIEWKCDKTANQVQCWSDAPEGERTNPKCT